MAQSTPTTWQELFDIVKRESMEFATPIEIRSHIARRIQEGQQYFQFMRGITTQDYYEYVNQKRLEAQERQHNVLTPTAQQFWHAAYSFNPYARHKADLVEMIASNKLKRIPLGQLYGTQLELEPDLKALRDSYARVYNIPLPRLVFPIAIGAVSFHECHPSEDGEMIRVRADNDTLLRRFLCLGWVIMVDGNDWTRTGHVMVIDMDETVNKRRHPWFLLASEWYDDHLLYPDGDRTIHAEHFVEQGRSDVDGIFPKTDNRTTVARLKSKELVEKKQTGPFLQYINRELKFELERFGQPDQQRNDPRYLKGTYLPVLMELYWNDRRKEEVCYNEDKMVYFRYKPLTREYKYDQPAATDNYIERLPRRIPAPSERAAAPSASIKMSKDFSYARRRRDRDASRSHAIET